jgi:hypothetical protein
MTGSDDPPELWQLGPSIFISPQHNVGARVILRSFAGTKEFHKIMIFTDDGKSIDVNWDKEIARKLNLSTDISGY